MFARASLLVAIILCIGCMDQEYPHDFPIVLTKRIFKIDSEGAEFIGSIESLRSTQKIVQYGFVWSEEEKPTLESSHLTISTAINTGEFSAVVNNDLKKDKTYFVRAFIQTDGLIIYGNSVSFISKGSKAPIISDFTPKKGLDETEVVIKGTNFSASPDGNEVKIGGVIAKVTSAKDSELKILIPKSSLVGDFKITINVGDNQAISSESLSIIGPRINSISKSTGRVGDLVIIGGELFSDENYMTLVFGPSQQWVSNYSYPYVNSTSQLECYVPDYPNTVGKISLLSNPSYQEFQAKSYVFPEEFTIINSWNNIAGEVPLEKNYFLGGTGFKSAQIGKFIYVLGGEQLYEFDCELKTWSKKADFPGEYRFFGTAFSHEGKVYYGFGEGYHSPPLSGQNGKFYNDLWVYDPSLNQWESFMNTSIPERRSPVSFVINGKAYIGVGFADVLYFPTHYSDLWEIDLSSKTLVQVNTPFAKSVSRATSFVVNNKAYLVGVETSYQSSDVWEFNPINFTWIRKTDFPGELTHDSATQSQDRGFVTVSNSKVIYEYDVFKDRWIKRQTHPGSSDVFQFIGYYSNSIILGTGNMWRLEL